MATEQNGELVPVGGGDNIPLIRNKLTIGRRESCYVCLRFPNISGLHCELSYQDGYWLIRDLGSKNGVKVNGVKVKQKALSGGDKIAVATREFVIEYTTRAGQRTLDEILDEEEDVMRQSLLERAGLSRPQRDDTPTPRRGGSASGWGGDNE
jgi:adenylate cyclase